MVTWWWGGCGVVVVGIGQGIEYMPIYVFSLDSEPGDETEPHILIAMSCTNDMKITPEGTTTWLTIVTFVLIRERITKSH